MRKLYILSGVPASGKSTFINKNGLAPYTLSADAIRQLYSNPVPSIDGGMVISEASSKVAWERLFEMLEYRMRLGETTIVDATHLAMRQVEPYKKLAKRYGYKLHLVKFGRDLTLEQLLERDAQRGLNSVGPNVVNKFYSRVVNFDKSLSGRYNPITPEQMLESLDWKIRDVSEYDAIKVIGDIHSSATVLNKALADFNHNTLYVFVGDYFDRGVEPVGVMAKLQELVKEPNVVLLMGNHEKHMYDFVSGNPIRSADFRDTIAELSRAGYKKSDFSKILNKLQHVYAARYNNFDLVFTHAGLLPVQLNGSLENYCKRLVLRNEAEFIKGLGDYDYPVVDAWSSEELACNQYYGHRNTRNYEVIHGNSNAFCLEQKVEFGGKLGVALIQKAGPDCITTIDESIANPVFNSDLLKTGRKSLSITKLRKSDSKLIREKEVGNGISVFNFTRDTFFNKVWNAETISARGLFVNKEGEIVARGYNKFFNVGERPETESKTLATFIKSVGGMLRLQDKENGFLGIISYIPELGGLTAFSKGAGEYHSSLTKDVLSAELAKRGHTWAELESFMKTDYEAGNKYSLTIEVCDVERDPHLTNYSEPTAFVLDAIRNDEFGHCLEDKTAEISAKFDLPRPAIHKVDVDSMSSEQVLQLIDDTIHSTESNEGVVFTFGDNQKVKVKRDWYLKRKKLRGIFAAYFKNSKSIQGLTKKTPEWLPVLDLIQDAEITWYERDGHREVNIPKTLDNPANAAIQQFLHQI